MGLQMSIAVNQNLICEIVLVNTGHKNKHTGQHLYRFQVPPALNHHELYHDRKKPWYELIEKAINILKQREGHELDHGRFIPTEEDFEQKMPTEAEHKKRKAKEKKEYEAKKKKVFVAMDAVDARIDKAYADKYGSGALCGITYSAYPTDEDGVPIDNLDEVAVEGPAIFVNANKLGWGNGSPYKSAIIENATWLELTLVASEMMKITGDDHHSFFEGIHCLTSDKDEVPQYDFIMGS